MNIIFHRGYVGIQPFQTMLQLPEQHRMFCIDQYIEDGRLLIPISEDALDLDELGDKGFVSNFYITSKRVHVQYLLWDSRGPSNLVVRKQTKEGDGVAPSAIHVPYDRAWIDSIVFSDTIEDMEYLRALVQADATLEQINQFCTEHPGFSPFVWILYADLHQKILKSKGIVRERHYQQPRTGPSKYLLSKQMMDAADMKKPTKPVRRRKPVQRSRKK